MRENTIKTHAELLRELDIEKYNQMMAELTVHGQREYFYQTLRNNPSYSLHNVRSIVRDIMIKYLGFTAENFHSNTMPILPEKEAKALADALN